MVLVSSENRPEQFFQFQNARAAVVHALGLKQRTAGKIIHQHGFEDDRESSLVGGKGEEGEEKNAEEREEGNGESTPIAPIADTLPR